MHFFKSLQLHSLLWISGISGMLYCIFELKGLIFEEWANIFCIIGGVHQLFHKRTVLENLCGIHDANHISSYEQWLRSWASMPLTRSTHPDTCIAVSMRNTSGSTRSSRLETIVLPPFREVATVRVSVPYQLVLPPTPAWLKANTTHSMALDVLCTDRLVHFY